MPFINFHSYPASRAIPLQACYGTEAAGFGPLVRLLNDWDAAARDASQHRHRHHRNHQQQAAAPSFVPKFDVIETDTEFQLHGELGGLNKKDVNIEFTDEHTLVIKGRVEKSYNTTNSAQEEQQVDEASGANGAVPEAETTTAAAAASSADDEDITESTIIEAPAEIVSHQATVSDEEDEDDFEEKQDSAAIKALQQQKKQQQEEEEQQRQLRELQRQEQERAAQQQQQEATYKYWLAERSVGEFTRVFKFPGRIERDGVTAGLENGILTVTVPKAKKLAAREIPIF